MSEERRRIEGGNTLLLVALQAHHAALCSLRLAAVFSCEIEPMAVSLLTFQYQRDIYSISRILLLNYLTTLCISLRE